MGDYRIKKEGEMEVAYETDLLGNEQRIGVVKHDWLSGKDHVDRDDFQPFEPAIEVEPRSSLFPDLQKREATVGDREGSFVPESDFGGYRHHEFRGRTGGQPVSSSATRGASPSLDSAPSATAPSHLGRWVPLLMTLAVGALAVVGIQQQAPTQTTVAFSGQIRIGTGTGAPHHFSMSRNGTLTIRTIRGRQLGITVCSGVVTEYRTCASGFTLAGDSWKGQVDAGDKTLFVYDNATVYAHLPYVIEVTFH